VFRVGRKCSVKGRRREDIKQNGPGGISFLFTLVVGVQGSFLRYSGFLFFVCFFCLLLWGGRSTLGRWEWVRPSGSFLSPALSTSLVPSRSFFFLFFVFVSLTRNRHDLFPFLRLLTAERSDNSETGGRKNKKTEEKVLSESTYPKLTHAQCGDGRGREGGHLKEGRSVVRYFALPGSYRKNKIQNQIGFGE